MYNLSDGPFTLTPLDSTQVTFSKPQSHSSAACSNGRGIVPFHLVPRAELARARWRPTVKTIGHLCASLQSVCMMPQWAAAQSRASLAETFRVRVSTLTAGLPSSNPRRRRSAPCLACRPLVSATSRAFDFPRGDPSPRVGERRT